MHMMVTSSAGFIDSHFVRYWLECHLNGCVRNLNALTYAGNLPTLDDVASRFGHRYTFVQGDIGSVELVEHLLAEHCIDVIVNVAESYNRRAALDLAIFLRTNVLGTPGLIEASRRQHTPRNHVIYRARGLVASTTTAPGGSPKCLAVHQSAWVR